MDLSVNMKHCCVKHSPSLNVIALQLYIISKISGNCLQRILKTVSLSSSQFIVCDTPSKKYIVMINICTYSSSVEPKI